MLHVVQLSSDDSAMVSDSGDEPTRLTTEMVFPLVSEAVGLDWGLLDRPVATLSTDEVAAISAAQLQMYVDRGYRLGAMFPALYSVRDSRLTEGLIGVRAFNALRRKGVLTWGEICGLRAADLLLVPNVGMNSVVAVVEGAVNYSASLNSTPVFDGASSELLEATNGSWRADASIGELRPQLRSVPITDVPGWAIPQRLKPLLEGLPWIQLLDVKLEALLTRPNVGRQSVVELLDRLSQLAPRGSVGSEVGGYPRELDELVDAVGSIAQWVYRERGLTTLADLISLAPDQSPLPARISNEWHRILTSEIPVVEHPLVRALLGELVDSFEDRELEILRQRVWNRGAPPTLEELGDNNGLTRERVRQVQARVVRELNERLAAPRYFPISDRAQELRLRLGSTVRRHSTRWDAALAWLTRDLTDELRSDGEALMLWMAGPYRERDEWMLAHTARPSAEISAEIARHAEETGVASAEDVRSLLLSHEIHEDQQELWMQTFGRLRPLDGGWFLSSGNVIDAAVRFLKYRGEPLTVEEILEGLGRDASLRSVRQRLFEDERVHRVTKSDFALREWGMDEYTSVAAEMVEEIERSGGGVRLDELVERLAARHDISPVSVRMYATRPMFVIDAQDRVSVRQDSSSYAVGSDLTAVPLCYELEPGVASWRVKVDSEIIRGSGRRIPEPLAGWLGLTPGNQMELAHTAGSTLLSWTAWGQPTIGSLKYFVDSAAGAAGGWLVLVFRSPCALAVHYVANPAAPDLNFETVARMVGVTESTEALANLATVLGIEPSSDNLAFRVRGTLASRGDEELVSIVDRIMFG
jgi:Sigma-70, region 4